MLTELNHTPLEVKPRRMDFPFDVMQQRDFFDNNVLKSAYIAALSATFPAGEAEFIASVRLFRDDVKDPELKKEIKGFIGQEGHHSHQHKQFNKALSELGYDAVGIEEIFEKDLAFSIKPLSPKQRLAFTVCFEHQTAILAEEFLTNPAILKGMDPVIADLLRWHAVEEIEHKGVAFDVYMNCVGDRQLLKRCQKIGVMMFSYRITKYMLKMLWRAKRKPSIKDIRGYLSFMFGKGGLIPKLRAPYKDFFREDFHPWDNQNAHLIEDWKNNSYRPEYDRSNQEYWAA